MKALIIGAKGMLGQELVNAFKEGGEVVPWDKEDVDITKREDLRFKIKDLGPEVIINAAAYNNVDGAESEPEVANLVNGYAVGYLASVCKELDIPLVHYSTDYVFDGKKKGGYAENHEPHPLSKYGDSKLLGERELQKNTDKFYLVRLSRLFGRPALSSGAKKSFVETMLKLAKTKPQLEVVDEEVSLPTYAPDAARFTKTLMENRYAYGTYHGANSGSGVSWYGFAKQIFEIANIDVKLIPVPASHFPRPAKRPTYGILLNTKLPPQRHWHEALEEFLTS